MEAQRDCTVTEQPAGGIEDKVIAMCKTAETDNCCRLPVNIAACEEGGHQLEQRWRSRSRAMPVSRYSGQFLWKIPPTCKVG